MVCAKTLCPTLIQYLDYRDQGQWGVAVFVNSYRQYSGFRPKFWEYHTRQNICTATAKNGEIHIAHRARITPIRENSSRRNTVVYSRQYRSPIADLLSFCSTRIILASYGARWITRSRAGTRLSLLPLLSIVGGLRDFFPYPKKKNQHRRRPLVFKFPSGRIFCILFTRR